MKKILKLRTLSIAIAVMLTLTCMTVTGNYRAYATYRGPEILITEIMPMSQSGDDEYEYIELYNNSDHIIDLKDYKLPYQSIDFTASKLIPPRGIIVVCTRSTTTLLSFNTFYGTSLTEDKYTTLGSLDEILDNSGNLTKRVLISEDDGLVVSRANYDINDFDIKKSVTYKYPPSGFDMGKLGIKQSPTPGSIQAAQIPDSGVSVTGITLDKQYMTMEVNQTAALYATVVPATASNKSVLWASEDPDVVQIDSTGVLTARKEGLAIITAKTVDGGFTATCIVLVNRIPVAGVTLDKTNITLDVGQAVVLSPTVSPADATNKKVTWSSSSNTAVVDSNGLVKAKYPGTAVITVKTVDGNYTASCTVQVDDDTDVRVTGVLLDKTNVTLETGKVIILQALIKPSNATNKKVFWSASNPDIASVDEDGVVYAKKEGSSSITVKTDDGGYTASCSVTVTKKTEDNHVVTGLRLNKSSISLKTGKSQRIVPIITPGSLKNIKLDWKVDKKEVAAVTTDGWVIGLGEGHAVVTVSTSDGKYSAECDIYVNAHDNGKPKGH